MWHFGLGEFCVKNRHKSFECNIIKNDINEDALIARKGFNKGEKIMDSYRRRYQKKMEVLLQHCKNILPWIISALLMMIYVVLAIRTPHVIHKETSLSMPVYLYESNNRITETFSKIFNLNILEGGGVSATGIRFPGADFG